MCCIGDVGSSGILEKFDLSHDGLVVESIDERRGGSVTTQDIGVQSGSLYRRGFLGELDIIDGDVNYLRLCLLGITIVVLIGVDAKLILYISLDFNVLHRFLYILD